MCVVNTCRFVGLRKIWFAVQAMFVVTVLLLNREQGLEISGLELACLSRNHLPPRRTGTGLVAGVISPLPGAWVLVHPGCLIPRVSSRSTVPRLLDASSHLVHCRCMLSQLVVVA